MIYFLKLVLNKDVFVPCFLRTIFLFIFYLIFIFYIFIVKRMSLCLVTSIWVDFFSFGILTISAVLNRSISTNVRLTIET